LKRKGWRFHKKYMTWFQRHDHPVEANEDYERGTYVYFDYDAVRSSPWPS
jgi:CCR4-NOT transcription complex subunit 3